MTPAPGPSALFAVAGVEPRDVLRPANREELAGELTRAREAGHSVVPRGEGTRMHLGAPPARLDAVVLTGGLNRVVAWEPGDLTVTVEAGVRLADLARLLAGRGQVLPLQCDRAGGTIGGLVATGEDGALALGCGRIHDFILGVSVGLADGTIAKGRGALVKNVAGYDTPRLLVGSLGTLGVIVEASFKLLPLPEATASLLFEFPAMADAFAAGQRVLDSSIEPVFVNVLSGFSGEAAGEGASHRLAVGLQGSTVRVRGLRAAVEDRVAGGGASGRTLLEGADDRKFRAELDEPVAVWASPGRSVGDSLPETGPDGGRGPGTVVKCLALPSRIAELADRIRACSLSAGAALRFDARPGLGILYAALDAAEPAALRAATAAVLEESRSEGRSAILISAPPPLRAALDVWGPPPPDFFLMKRIKDALDPTGVLARGRFVGRL